MARLIVLAMLLLRSLCGQSLPPVEGETLSGKHVVLPDAARGHVTLLVFGFSKGSQTATSAYGLRFRLQFSSDPRYALYEIAVLESVPRLIRGMVTSGIRKGTPPERQDFFLTLFKGEKALKEFSGYKAEDDAYLVLLDTQGTVRWRGHGLYRDTDYAALVEQAQKLSQ